MTTPKLHCDGDYMCTPPKECCSLGCCYLFAPPSNSFFNIVFWNHWYLWCVLLFCLILCCACVCGLWKKREERLANDDVRSELSVGSYYQPPRYSRCSSFNQPPPYSEVTTKPDLYPLVISYSDNNKSRRGSSLMVQYFRNYILRPVGSLSGTSTADSLSSSLFCNVSSEVNILVPPPYSSAPGSVDQLQMPILPIHQSRQSHSQQIDMNRGNEMVTEHSDEIDAVTANFHCAARRSLSLQINKEKYWPSRSAPATPATRLMPSIFPTGESSPLLPNESHQI